VVPLSNRDKGGGRGAELQRITDGFLQLTHAGTEAAVALGEQGIEPALASPALMALRERRIRILSCWQGPQSLLRMLDPTNYGRPGPDQAKLLEVTLLVSFVCRLTTF
jgi:hypothetical protein